MTPGPTSLSPTPDPPTRPASMKKFLMILIVLVALVGFVIPQFFISKSYAMDRGTEIEAPAADVHATLTDLATWQEWSAWNLENDPSLKYEYTGTPGTIGHRMDWTSDKDGKGGLELTKIDPGRIEYKMDMEGWDPSYGGFTLTPVGDNVSVTWDMTGEFTGMPAKRYFGLMMDGMVGPMFEEGLQGLKARHEGGAAPEPNGE